MADTIENIRKECKRLGCAFTVEAVPDQPSLCKIDGPGIQSPGIYDAHRALSAFQQLQTPDIGDNIYQMIDVALRQIGHAQH